ncbi:MAG TPA: hypothetical protein VH138_01115 [Vicinamibacterales bacterium]|nr:hypothetical protein [Vicinamibacterales bacterium]
MPSRPADLSRRELLKTALAIPMLRAFDRQGPPRAALTDIAKARAYAVAEGSTAGLTIARDWQGNRCRSRLINQGSQTIRVREVVLFDLNLDFPASTPIYGESFQMLSQSGGTLGAPKDLGSYTDAKHYRIPMAEGAQTYFGAMTLSPPGAPARGLAFTSIRRFAGSFRLRASESLQVVVDTEGLTLAPGERWELEEFVVAAGSTRDAVLAEIAARIVANHPRLRWPAPPTGWCSWYCFGARVTAQNILDNLDAIEKKLPGLTYIQIDDGYQPAMGDWLETGAAFGGDVRKVLDEIRRRGFRPAIWVAPFIAEAESHLFKQHP